MENTSNYGLKRWDGGDRILHTEFNDNWDKIDTALKSSADGVAALQTALASCGNCKIVYGTYTGNGKSVLLRHWGSRPCADGIPHIQAPQIHLPSATLHGENILFLGTTVRAVVTNSIPVILSIPISRCLPLRNKTRPRTSVRGLVLNRRYLNS